MKYISLALSAFLLSSTATADIQKAQLFYDYDLLPEAKKELIEIVSDEKQKESHAKALFMLGNISFDERKFSVATETWKKIILEYPDSSEAKAVIERIELMKNVFGDFERESAINEVARQYISNGDFWSKGKRNSFLIDSSWIANVDAAIKWYDKVIKEYPRTQAAKIAYEKKMLTILGWEESGRSDTKYGMRESYVRYMPMVVETFTGYLQEFPDSTSIPAFQHQIAQEFWRNRDWKNTRSWLNDILLKSGAKETFYSDLARRRLAKLEY